MEVARWQVHVFDELANLEIAQWERVIATETYLFGTYGVENELECGSIVGDAIHPKFAQIFTRASLIVDSHQVGAAVEAMLYASDSGNK